MERSDNVFEVHVESYVWVDGETYIRTWEVGVPEPELLPDEQWDALAEGIRIGTGSVASGIGRIEARQNRG